MKVTIALPAYYNFPIGGYYVHYQYANLLVAQGHNVTILFPRYLDVDRSWKTPASTLLWEVTTRLKNKPLIPTFSLDKRVKIKLVGDLDERSLPAADVLIATAWQTAEALQNASGSRGKKYYVVYDYEYWMTAEPDMKRRIEQTFTGCFNIISTSTAVERMIQHCGGGTVAKITCGLNLENFGIDVAPEARSNFSFGFPARRESFKGRDDAIAAALILRERYGENLVVTAFGSHNVNLPDWINWLEFPSQTALRGFYNSNAVFLLPSHFEGWGLTGIEAMACGAALVVTDNGGSNDYAFDGKNAIVAQPKAPEELAAAIAQLFDNPELRCKMAHAGRDTAQQFTWSRAGAALNTLLTHAA